MRRKQDRQRKANGDRKRSKALQGIPVQSENAFPSAVKYGNCRIFVPRRPTRTRTRTRKIHVENSTLSYGLCGVQRSGTRRGSSRGGAGCRVGWSGVGLELCRWRQLGGTWTPPAESWLKERRGGEEDGMREQGRECGA